MTKLVPGIAANSTQPQLLQLSVEGVSEHRKIDMEPVTIAIIGQPRRVALMR